MSELFGLTFLVDVDHALLETDGAKRMMSQKFEINDEVQVKRFWISY